MIRLKVCDAPPTLLMVPPIELILILCYSKGVKTLNFMNAKLNALHYIDIGVSFLLQSRSQDYMTQSYYYDLLSMLYIKIVIQTLIYFSILQRLLITLGLSL